MAASRTGGVLVCKFRWLPSFSYRHAVFKPFPLKGILEADGIAHRTDRRLGATGNRIIELIGTRPRRSLFLGAGRRTIAIPGPLVDLLRGHREIQEQERIAAGSLWEDHEFVFTQPNGRPVDPKADQQAWKDLLEEAGVREARLHDARHTAATML